MKSLSIGPMSLSLTAWCHGQSQEFFGLVQSGQTDKVTTILKADPPLVNARDRAERTPLFVAVSAGDTAMIDLLLEKGAVIDTRAIGAATPLIHSSLNENFDMIRFLIERGPGIDIQCNSPTTPCISPYSTTPGTISGI